MIQILDGKRIAERLLKKLAKEVKKRGLKLTLAVVFVGKNEVSQKYLVQKRKASEKAGLGFRVYDFPGHIGQRELAEGIQKIALDRNNSGIVVQLPLPKKLAVDKILNLLPSTKDPDCLTLVNFELFRQGNPLVLPPVVGAVKELLAEYRIKVANKSAFVVGAGQLVGLPVSIWLRREGARVLVGDKKTKNLAGLVRKADIVISGAGCPGLVKGSMIKRGAAVIDCGTSVENSQTVGDIETESVTKKASFLAPVPGGVGPLAVACLLENLVRSRASHKKNAEGGS